MEIRDKIKARRTELGLTLEQVGNYVGVSKSTVRKWESGYISNMRRDKIAKLAEVLQLSPLDIAIDGDATGTSAPVIVPPGFRPLPEMAAVPLIGDIACGTPITAEENVKSYIGIPSLWRADFALECRGDSMAPRICDGDIVCIRQQPTVEPGQIAAVRIDGEATLKRFYQRGDVVQLIAENSAYPPLVYSGEELNEIHIEGLAVGFCRGLIEERL